MITALKVCQGREQGAKFRFRTVQKGLLADLILSWDLRDEKKMARRKAIRKSISSTVWKSTYKDSEGGKKLSLFEKLNEKTG